MAIVEPGSIDTPIWERGEENAEQVLARSPRSEQLYGKAIERFGEVVRQTAGRGIPAEKVAEAIVHALSRSTLAAATWWDSTPASRPACCR